MEEGDLAPMPLNSTYGHMLHHHHHDAALDDKVRYRECLKNHAAAMGGNATDGCGEFMASGDEGLTCSACSCHRNFHRKELEGKVFHHRPIRAHPMIMSYAMAASDHSDDQNGQKKRFRTKFTAEQKEKMLNFAEKVGWKIQKQEEGVVQHFCQEVGVKRRVLKVWMHNNKHTLAKKNIHSDPQNQLL